MTDPAVNNVFRVLGVLSVVLLVALFSHVSGVVRTGGPVSAPYLLRVVLFTILLSATMVSGLTHFGFNRSTQAMHKLLEELGLKERHLKTYSLEDLQGLAETVLARRAYCVRQAERLSNNPYDEERVRMKGEFEYAYDLLLAFGLIGDVGYGYFFKRAKPPAE
jgi:hypothetical protein